MEKRAEQNRKIDNAWKSRTADLELSGYNLIRIGCFIQFVTRGAGDQIREHYNMCDRFAAEQFRQMAGLLLLDEARSNHSTQSITC